MSTTDEREAYQGDEQDFRHKQSLRTDAAAAHNGASVQSDECDEGRVYRWEVSPHPYSSDFDTFVTDDDDQARQGALDAAEAIWDDMDVGEERCVTIKRNRE